MKLTLKCPDVAWNLAICANIYTTLFTENVDNKESRGFISNLLVASRGIECNYTKRKKAVPRTKIGKQIWFITFFLFQMEQGNSSNFSYYLSCQRAKCFFLSFACF